jgi:GxxExxY protein
LVLAEEALTRAALDAFYRVYNRLGFGFLESVYVNALTLELRRDGLQVRREAPMAVVYDGVVIGSYRADLLVNDRLILEVKADVSLTAGPERQLLNDLRCSDVEVGILLMFGLKPRFKRLIHTRDRKATAIGTQSPQPS